MLNRPAIKNFAKGQMRNQYGLALGSLLIYLLLGSAVSTVTCGIGTIILLPVISIGLALIQIRIFRGQAASIGDLFSGFNQFGRNLGGMLWMDLWIFLWSLLFVIPGIVKSFAYCLTPYILADCPNVSATQALKLSMAMTDGHKADIFVFYLSFIGWTLLSSLTCGLLYLFYTGPYMQISMAGLYDELKQQAIARGIVDASYFA